MPIRERRGTASVVAPGDRHDDLSSTYWREAAKLRGFLIRVAASRCSSSSDPEDIVHEALVRAACYPDLDLERLPQFLVTVVIRLCIDESRRTTVAVRMARDRRLFPASSQDPSESVCDRAEAQWLERRLANFSSRDRKLVSMVTDGLPSAEIARVLHITQQGTYSALYRIRRRINSCYAG
ncbi:sigma-70 family RNA polymerase sigma factor [Amycolatopsis sp. EV170708-02-1]|uniref:sigma-70 family RNA polymerase sigma factor n=1 Tax=Amycolatopsis sp. EV170708-02-1 TaxID=2919322 RepID=UPI001F0C6E6A|nr:sigma-70 family RNA polymerase sigma factor [Amycolatopsis sp. EV170708-02-1]UMP06798.1 sigma-70 family RNA polymerase sigma factor [Amycolatopsis sp. EV170708-02-1]